MGVPVEDIQQALEWIRKLDPKPGRRYDSTRTIYVEPDVAVVKVEDDYVVVFNDDGLPRLKVSALYRRMLLSRDGNLDGEGKSYLREKMRAAQWLLKSLDQRKRTIVRVAESIVKKQRDFLDWGVAHLKPLVLRDVAEDIGMHESTVSRVVSNKWMATPRGLVPMKFFFHSAIASTGGEDVSSLAVKNKIRGLIEAEDAAHPLSDARLAELLAHEGIQIARRTVAKYREELRIPPSSIRRTRRPGAASRRVPRVRGRARGPSPGSLPNRRSHEDRPTSRATSESTPGSARTSRRSSPGSSGSSRLAPQARVVVTAGKKDVEVEVTVADKTRTITATARGADQRTAAQAAMERLAGQVRKTKVDPEGVQEAPALGRPRRRDLDRGRARGRAVVRSRPEARGREPAGDVRGGRPHALRGLEARVHGVPRRGIRAPDPVPVPAARRGLPPRRARIAVRDPSEPRAPRCGPST